MFSLNMRDFLTIDEYTFFFFSVHFLTVRRKHLWEPAKTGKNEKRIKVCRIRKSRNASSAFYDCQLFARATAELNIAKRAFYFQFCGKLPHRKVQKEHTLSISPLRFIFFFKAAVSQPTDAKRKAKHFFLSFGACALCSF